jgi:microcystin-dependent protein
MAAHTHTLAAQNALSTSADPAGNTFGKKPFGGRDIFAAPGNPTPLDAASLKPAGGSQPHDNMQPFGTLNFVIALQGIFPSRN